MISAATDRDTRIDLNLRYAVGAGDLSDLFVEVHVGTCSGPARPRFRLGNIAAGASGAVIAARLQSLVEGKFSIASPAS
jgi:N-acetylmuramoyl-L-alanine amidase